MMLSNKDLVMMGRKRESCELSISLARRADLESTKEI